MEPQRQPHWRGYQSDLKRHGFRKLHGCGDNQRLSECSISSNRSDRQPDSRNPNDHARFTQEDYPLAERRATIVTYTADSLSYTPAPPLYYGLIDFEGGGRMKVEFADVEEGDVEVGRELEMVFRIHAVDERRNFKRYFWKAAPAATEA